MNNLPSTIEAVLIGGDLAKLGANERLNYYHRVCESLSLNPLTMPFQYINLNGKLVLYATKGATQQLAALRGISFNTPNIQQFGDLYCVTITCKDKDGRTDCDMGAVDVKGLQGERLANAMMKAITKAKRRAVLSLCSLNMLDETEVETIPGAKVEPITVTTEQPKQLSSRAIQPDGTVVDTQTGEIIEKLQDAFPGSTIEEPQIKYDSPESGIFYYKLPSEKYCTYDMKSIRQEIHKLFGKGGYDYTADRPEEKGRKYMHVTPYRLQAVIKSNFPFAEWETDENGNYIIEESESRKLYFKAIQDSKKKAAPKTPIAQKTAAEVFGNDDIPM